MTEGVTVLGSTGSIGVQTLEVLALHPERYSVFALAASQNVEAMVAQCMRFSPRYVVMTQPAAQKRLREKLALEGCRTEVLHAPDALEIIARHSDAAVVMAAIVGVAGLRSCMAAALAGKRLLLANKEALVVAGSWLMQAVAQGGATLLPVDSEHSAIFQCLPQERVRWQEDVEKIILTASGGPFRTLPLKDFPAITPDQAVAHPNWVMGRKISVDSATMMNKALEVIEAHHLFSMPLERLEVIIHPQSVVHSMVQYRDASVLAQMGSPDMRVPIACALSWPQRICSGVKGLNWRDLNALTFEEVDAAKFPALRLAWHALLAGVGYTAVLNAANEVAVAAFLDGQLRFDRIAAVAEECLQMLSFLAPQGLDDVMEIDGRARTLAANLCQSRTGRLVA